ncbi:MAG: hypothetical protein HY539_04295 [Deltaproteobacteria bacterium]|nr:hypothetical protein [Deltaproteobacteria bacterium]MBI4197024.1 hypothetical protein [Deltaproteobacteria bacterium]
MKTGSKRSKARKAYSETDIDRWLKGADLSRLSSKIKFHKVSFSNLQPTDWDNLYEDFQRSKPISIRLPVRVIDKLKQVSLQKGIAYQSLIRMWVTEKLQMGS